MVGSGPSSEVCLNLQFLDTLVMEYVEYANKCARLIDPTDAEGCLETIRAGTTIREAILAGDSERALRTAASLRQKTATLQDRHMTFVLKKQHFVELMRQHRELEALEYLQRELMPFALNAYPEAYNDLLAALECLLHHEQSQHAPKDWCLEEREKLANLLSASLQLEAGVYVPRLGLILAYLGLHSYHFPRPPVSDGASDGREMLEDYIAGDKRSGIVPRLPLPSLRSGRAPERIAAAVQNCSALAQGMVISTQEALDALHLAQGDMSVALKRELMRVPCRADVLQPVILDYCCLRGLSAGVLASRSASPECAAAGGAVACAGAQHRMPDQGDAAPATRGTADLLAARAAERGSARRPGATGQPAAVAAQSAAAGAEGLHPRAGLEAESSGAVEPSDAKATSPEPMPARHHRHPADAPDLDQAVVGRFAPPPVASRPSFQPPAPGRPPLSPSARQAVHVPAAPEPPATGDASRISDAQHAHRQPSAATSPRAQDSALATAAATRARHAGVPPPAEQQQQHDDWLDALEAAALQGNVLRVGAMVAEAHNEQELPPQLQFGLWRLAFVQATARGELDAAQGIATEHLGPLARRHSDLLPLLKATMPVLVADAAALHALQRELRVDLALQLRTAFAHRPQPQGAHASKLEAMLCNGLAAHRAFFASDGDDADWPASEACAALLDIPHLLQGSAAHPPPPPPRPPVAPHQQRLVSWTVSPRAVLPIEPMEAFSSDEDMSEEQSDDDADGVDDGDDDALELSVIQLMEILDMPSPGFARDLLRQHDGDLQAAVSSIMDA